MNINPKHIAKKVFWPIFWIIFAIIFVLVAQSIVKSILPSAPKQKQVVSEDASTKGVSGLLFGNTVWSGEILVSGDVVVPPLSTLTIEPGTIVRFTAGSDDRPSVFDIEIPADGFNDDDPTRTKNYTDSHTTMIVSGSLIAEGTSELPITFTSDSSQPHYADWGGVNLVGAASTLTHVVVEYSRNGISVPSDNPDITVTESIVRHAMWGCFSIAGATGLYEHNLAEDCGHEGFDVKGASTVRNNRVVDSHASVVVLGGSPLIENNVFEDEIHVFEGATPILKNNSYDRSRACAASKTWNYENYHIPCRGEPYLE